MKALDTNVFYTYAINFDAEGERGRPVMVQRYNRDAVVAAVDDAIWSSALAIPDAVAAEARKNAVGAIKSAAGAAGASYYARDMAAGGMLATLDRLYGRFRVKDDDGYVGKIDGMYADIWSDKRMENAISSRRRVKEKHGKKAARPMPDTHEQDFVILSTAASLAAQGGTIELLTFDHDFVSFADAIRERLAVDIVDCGRL